MIRTLRGVFEHAILVKLLLSDIQVQSLIKRTYLLENIGLEVFFSGRNSLFLTFKTTQERDVIASE